MLPSPLPGQSTGYSVQYLYSVLGLQVQLQILRFCANTSLNYFMRTMGPSAARVAASRHDALVEEAIHKCVITASATHGERSRAVQQGVMLPKGDTLLP